MEARAEDIAVSVGERRPLQVMRRLLATNDLLRHNALLFAATIATNLFSLLFHPVVGRMLGEVQYGIVISLLALTSILSVPTQIILTVFNKFTADLTATGHVDQANYLFRWATRYALLLGVLVAVGLAAASSSVAHFLNLSSPQPILILSIGFVLIFAPALANGVLQGRQAFGWVGIIAFLNVFLRVAFAAALIGVGFGLYGAIWGLILSGTVVYAVTLWPLRDLLRAPQFRVPSLKPLFTYSLTTALTFAGYTILFNTDTLLAKHFLSQGDAGYYSALVTTGRTVYWFSGSLVAVMFPKVATLHVQGGAHRRILAWTMAGVFALSTCMLVFLGLFPKGIIALIFHFHAPPAVAHALAWYGLAMLIFALANVLMYYFLSLGRMTHLPIAVLLGSCVLQFALISIWHATITQIVASVIAVMATLLCGLLAVYILQVLADNRTARATHLQGQA